MENEQFIHDYENGSLSSEKKQAFELRYSSDKAFAEEVKEYRNLKSAIKEKERLDLKSTLQDLEKQKEITPEITDEENISFGRKYRHIYVAAAVIVFAVIGFQFLEKETSNQDLYASFYQPYPNTLQPVTRSEASTDVLSQAFQAYEANEFEKAEVLFETSLTQEYNSDIAFYKAMTLLNMKNDEEGSDLLKQLKNESTSFKPQLYWYSALLALKKNDEQQAKEQLDSLSQLNSGYKKSAILKIKKLLAD